MDRAPGDWVSIAGIEVPRTALEARADAESAPDAPAAKLRELLATHPTVQYLPHHGWLRLVEEPGHVAFAVRASELWWMVVHVRQRGDGWAWWATHPGKEEPTRAERGRGLRLVWDADPFVARVGERPPVVVLLRNDRTDGWVDNRGEYKPVVTAFNFATGKEVSPPERLEWFGVGRFYDLAPGEAVELSIVLAIAEPDHLPVGEYGLRAVLRDLDLRSDVGRLLITN